jgi:hypothetical protein
MRHPDQARLRHLVEDAIKRMSLDLRGWIVLTEAATGHYALTPIIAALAGAPRVLALAKDSRFGAAAEVAAALQRQAKAWGAGGAVETLTARDDPRIAEADIVTNLGNVRPIDRGMLARLKTAAVVSLMWETWEFRAEDVDRDECRRRHIPLLGTNEHHPDLDTFGYVGPVVVKLLFAAGIEVLRSRIVVAGSGEFAARAAECLKAMRAEITAIDTRTPGALDSAGARDCLARADALVVVDHTTRRPLIGPGGDIGSGDLASLNPGLSIIHLCGGVDRDGLAAHGLTLVPDRFAPVGYMSVATDYVGPKPLIDLHAAGLCVGQSLRLATSRGLSGAEAEAWALTHCPYAQGFSDRHRGA